mmetsp:Transcript_2157/g.2441  ORF Transcript_2157/g.2441 Transcript_2157/m.2441 type:complete len:101 (-) Transcript_2157:137-439(-)
MMMMMLDYVNLLVGYDSMSVSILSQNDNYYTFIPRIYVFIGGSGGGDGDGDGVFFFAGVFLVACAASVVVVFFPDIVLAFVFTFTVVMGGDDVDGFFFLR